MKLIATDNANMTGHLDQKIGSFNKVVVIGLGQLGLPVAKYVKERGFEVYGYDINAFALDRAEKEFGVKKINDFTAMDVFIICVSTHKPDDIFAPYLDGLFAVVHKISNEAKNGTLLSIVTKIIENADRYLQIAFAEELYLYCQANHINFSELKDALNTKWNVHILEPRDGIGGHCVPKDTKMFLDSSRTMKSKILLAALEADQDYRKFREMRDKQFKSDSTVNDRQLLPS